MRPATVVRILVVIAVAWAAALLVRSAQGVPSTRASVGGLFAFGVIAGGLAFAAYRFRVAPRRGSFADQVAAAGLRGVAGDPLGLLGQPFALFRLAGSARDLENTATGVRDGREIVVADYWFAPSSNPSLDDVRRFVCVIDAERPGWPDLAVLPPTVGASVRDAIGLRGVELESDAFNRAFDVRCADPRFANALLDARMMAWLLDQAPESGVEIVEGRLMVFGRRATASLDDVERALHRFDGFLAHVPAVVPSLFPADARP